MGPYESHTAKGFECQCDTFILNLVQAGQHIKGKFPIILPSDATGRPSISDHGGMSGKAKEVNKVSQFSFKKKNAHTEVLSTNLLQDSKMSVI